MPDKSTEDPNSGAVSNPNQIPGLLNGDNPAVSQAMGITVSSPHPVLSEDQIPPFDYKTFFIEDAAKPFGFSVVNDMTGPWEPQAEDSTPKAWENVRKQWDSTPGFGENAADDFIKLWSELEYFKWDTTGDNALTGQKPKKLLKDEETFGKLFLEAPRLGVAVA